MKAAVIRSTVALSVLLVDPSTDERTMYAEYLGFRGMTTIQSPTTSGALKVACERLPNVIVLEPCVHRSTSDGLAFIRTLRSDARTRQIPIVVVSGHALDNERAAAMDAGCDAFFAKPFLPTSLAAAVERIARVPPKPGNSGSSSPIG